MNDFEKLALMVDQYSKLLASPQPGLTSWCVDFARRTMDLRDELTEWLEGHEKPSA